MSRFFVSLCLVCLLGCVQSHPNYAPQYPPTTLPPTPYFPAPYPGVQPGYSLQQIQGTLAPYPVQRKRLGGFYLSFAAAVQSKQIKNTGQFRAVHTDALKLFLELNQDYRMVPSVGVMIDQLISEVPGMGASAPTPEGKYEDKDLDPATFNALVQQLNMLGTALLQ